MAIHLLTAIKVFKNDYKVTSNFLASSINTNPVVVRRLLQQLKAAGLIEVARGTGGTALKKKADKITLYDVYRAVDCVENGELFHFHDAPNRSCKPCFKDNIAEFEAYLKENHIEMVGKFVAYHAAGGTFLPDVKAYDTRSSVDYNTNGGGAGITKNFKLT